MTEEEHNSICPQHGKKNVETILDTKAEMIEYLANNFTNEIFTEFWKHRKEDFKDLSKKEIAEEVFFQAIAEFLHNIMSDEIPEEEEKK